ncbi:MAG: hypothetical protein P4M11_07775 [Candidatus Pacebacteria bacterium]|nr:hypothetical protein [Candidatus Paceibacterota bacterium]
MFNRAPENVYYTNRIKRRNLADVEELRNGLVEVADGLVEEALAVAGADLVNVIFPISC